MISVVCGEDTGASREYYQSCLQSFKDKNYEVIMVYSADLSEINKWLGDSRSLFSEKKVFCIEQLNKKIRRDNKTVLEDLKKIAESKEIELLDWEEVTARDLKFAKLAKVKEFKPKQSIFSFLDSVYPGNRLPCIKAFRELGETSDPIFIYTMLCRHVRTLLTIKEGAGKSLPPWQVYKLKKQADSWKIDNLVLFYEGLGKIDISMKTSSSPFTMVQSLDILAVHFL